MILKKDSFYIYNQDMKRVTEPGFYQILIGASSEDIKLNARIKLVASHIILASAVRRAKILKKHASILVLACFVIPLGLEPRTPTLKVLCSTS